MRPRTRLPHRLVALAFALVLVAACATGGGPAADNTCGDTSKDPNNCGACGNVCPGGQVCQGSACKASCDPGTVNCGGLCVTTATDRNNCGKCGTKCSGDDVCVAGACALGCPPDKTKCTPVETPADAGSDATSDATVSDASSDGAGADAGDGGTKGPYCSDTKTDNENCGACNKVCPRYHTCNNGQCTLVCPPGYTTCSTGDTCASPNQCCTSADCKMTGEICSGPGGTCACPNGQKACSATNACIPNANCCTDGDCTLNAHVATARCGGGSCSIGTCQTGWVDLDQSYGDGCECADSPYARACNGATAVGPVAVGASTTAQGTLPIAGEEAWLQVTFGYTNQPNYHPHIVFNANPGNEFAFDISAGCGQGGVPCGEGGTCNAMTDWEVTGGGAPGGLTYSATPPVGNGGTVWVRVYRRAGNPTCNAYGLTISN